MIKYQDYVIRPNKTYPSSVEIYFPGKGGRLPDVLTGLFTSVGVAKEMIDRYLHNRHKKD